jgi:hypothetical protein
VAKSSAKIAVLFLLGALALFSAPGCQTLSRGRTQHIPATSRPAGVKVLVDGTAVGETPINLELTRRDIHVVRFELAGYRPVEIRITKKRPPLGETILMSAFWAPVGSVALGFPMFLVWSAVDKPEGEWGGMGQAFISAAAGFVVGWVAGTVIDSHRPSNFDLSPQTLFVQMEKAIGKAAPFIIEADSACLRRVRWIRVASK